MRSPPRWGGCFCFLIEELERKLNLPRVVRRVAGGTNLAECRTVVVAGPRDCDNAVTAEVRGVEVRVVGDIEKLRTELEAKPLVERDVFEDGKVRPVESRPFHLGETTQSGNSGQRSASLR